MKLSPLILAAFLSIAVATEKPPEPPKQSPTANASSDANAAAKANAAAVSGSKSTVNSTVRNDQYTQQSQSQNQSQSASGGNATNAGVSLSVSNEDRLQAPSVSAPALYASGLCLGGGSVGISGPGFGISGGRAKNEIEGCARREWFRLLKDSHPGLALAVACADPIVRASAGEGDCTYKPPTPPVVLEAPKVDTSNFVTREELIERDKRILQKVTSK